MTALRPENRIRELETELDRNQEEYVQSLKRCAEHATGLRAEVENLRAALQVLVDKETVDTGVRDWARSVLEARPTGSRFDDPGQQ